MAEAGTHAAYSELVSYLLEQTRRCINPPQMLFRHPWFSPMATPTTPAGDFLSGNYANAIFHHDASESAQEWVRHADLLDAAAGTLLCLLDNAGANGCIYRTVMPDRVRDVEPAKPVVAQFALRVFSALGEKAGRAWAQQHNVMGRVCAFLDWLEQHTTGAHGLMLTPSARASGFDSDPLSASWPPSTVEGPDASTFMVLDWRAAATLASQLGDSTTAQRMNAKANALALRMNQLLWHQDARGGFYTALRWQHGAHCAAEEVVSVPTPAGGQRPVESWASLLPLVAGIPDDTRAQQMIRRLLDADGYWSEVGVRTMPAWDEFFHQAPRVMLHDSRRGHASPVSNWCGPIWVLSNWYMAIALDRYGHSGHARDLTHKTARLLADDLKRTGMLHECYNDQGLGLWPVQGTFLSWNTLVLTMLERWGI